MTTTEAFIKKWHDTTTKERSAAQEHFIDLCHLLGEPTPNEADPNGVWYSFEKGASKTGGGDGWADVWKKGCFAWEYKGKGKDLNAALKQLQLYSLALQSPPLLIVSDIQNIIIHTAFTNAVQEVHTISLEDFTKPEVLQKLKWAFTEPERLRPGLTREGLTREAAERFAALAQSLRNRGFEPLRVAHFLNRLLFCLFSEDCGLLPKRLFSRLLENATNAPQHGETLLRGLFQAMTNGGAFGVEVIDWFNGGLFNDDDTLPLNASEFKQLSELSHLDWSNVEPVIFGTLFERGLDPDKRSQLGAHYTDRDSIMRLIDSVISMPLLTEWEACKDNIKALLEKNGSTKAKNESRKKAHTAYTSFLLRLQKFRVLDPACGSGNFLYLALQTLKDLEHRIILEAESLGLSRQFPSVGPEAVHGIEINPYAAELARVTVWIGEIQWMLQHGYNIGRNPILRPLNTIEQRDAILNTNCTEAEWPRADVIIGNPPFLGDKKMISLLGESYTANLRKAYEGRLPGAIDLVCYWFEKARMQIEEGKAHRAGLVATNSIRGGSSRKVLERILDTGRIFHAWSDEPWINEGAAVRVSLIGFSDKAEVWPTTLNGKAVTEIYADLTAGQKADSHDLTRAKTILENKEISFQGPVLIGPFEVEGKVAREWLCSPNPHGKPNSDVLRPITNGKDITSRSRGLWVVDFASLSEKEASLYELPFEYVRAHVKPVREANPRRNRRERWWIHGESGSGWRTIMKNLSRYIATSQVSKHRFFVWQPSQVWPHQTVISIARADNTTFGVLHSRFHEIWALRMGTSLEDRPRYTPTTTFETFPFPEGVLTAPNPDPVFPKIAEGAFHLNELREKWLNPPEWVKRVPEVVPSYPDMIIPKPEHAAELKKRTLTNLYNQRPAWLVQAHKTLDMAVAVAYGWTDYNEAIPDEEILRRLLTINEKKRGS